MITMVERSLNLHGCAEAIEELSTYLSKNDELQETGASGLHEFFLNRPDLILLMGDCFVTSMVPAAYQHEFSILGEFRADFAVANADFSKFLFVEFEDAKRDSVFRAKTTGATVTSYEWSPRFEHGFSQVVDWHYRMDDLRRTNKLEEHFGSHDVQYLGLLIIGRDSFVKSTGNTERLRWRKDHTIINSRPLHCLTFDHLLNELKGRLEMMKIISAVDL